MNRIKTVAILLSLSMNIEPRAAPLDAEISLGVIPGRNTLDLKLGEIWEIHDMGRENKKRA